jgi:hypothetical protein
MLELIRRAGLLSDEQLKRMGANGCGGCVSADEACAIARFIECEIISRLKDDEMIHADGKVSKQPPAPRLIVSTEPYELYAARKDRLESFVKFCKNCGGFKVM